jgi:hypothetical protein
MKHRFPFLLFFLLINAGCCSQQANLAPSPSQLPGITRQMKTAGFWASHHPDPDKKILDEHQIAALNASLEKEKHLTTDIGSFEQNISGELLKKELLTQYHNFTSRKLYFADGSVA